MRLVKSRWLLSRRRRPSVGALGGGGSLGGRQACCCLRVHRSWCCRRARALSRPVADRDAPRLPCLLHFGIFLDVACVEDEDLRKTVLPLRELNDRTIPVSFLSIFEFRDVASAGCTCTSAYDLSILRTSEVMSACLMVGTQLHQVS